MEDHYHCLFQTGRDFLWSVGQEMCALRLREVAEAAGATIGMKVSGPVNMELAIVKEELCKC